MGLNLALKFELFGLMLQTVSSNNRKYFMSSGAEVEPTLSPLRIKHKTNPFVTGDGQGLVVYKTKGETLETAGPLVVSDSKTGEIYSTAQIRQTKIVDGERFVKLFVRHLDAFFDLKPGTVKLLMALIEELSHARYAHGDTIYLNYSKVVDFFEAKGTKPPAKGTFFSAMAELTEKKIVAPSVDLNLWFVNPAVFFNGDRVRFVTELRRKRLSKTEQLEAAGQGALRLNDEEES
jgi:hypothetical protein